MQSALDSFAGGRCKAEHNSAPGPRSGSGISRRFCSVVSGRKYVVDAAVYGPAGAIHEALVRIPGERVVPLSAESHHLARDFFDAMQELGVCRLTGQCSRTQAGSWRRVFRSATVKYGYGFLATRTIE
jgi:hypothetical protein